MNQQLWGKYKSVCNECEICHSANLLDEKSFPIFQKDYPISTDILFILEAPNRDDTYNSDKGYLTVDPDTDPSGKFFHYLFTQVLGLDISELFITNSVLCLPKELNGKRPVSKDQRRYCSMYLNNLIDISDPLVVCTVGLPALKSTNIIEKHGLRNMHDSVGGVKEWYGRILFPVYHTGLLARNSNNGRSEELQIRDWMKLKEVLFNEKGK